MSVNEKLPSGWARASIADVSIKCSQRMPGEHEEITYIDIGSIDRSLKQIVAPKIFLGSEAPSRARKVVNAGDVLVSLTRPNLNAVALVPSELEDQIASTGFEVIKCLLVDSRYIFALTRSKDFIDSISGVVQGALYPAAKSSDVQTYVFPLPPLNEQPRIANKLDSLLAKVQDTQTRLEKIPRILKQFRQSVLAAATSGELTKEWRQVRVNDLANSFFEQGISEYDGSDLNDLPDKWCYVPFHVAAEIKSNLVDPKLTPDAIHLAPNHVEPNNGRVLDLVTVSQDDVTSGKHKFYSGQIVYSKIRPYLNKVCLVDFDGLCSADMYPISANIQSEYLLYCMLSTQFVDFTSRQQGRVVLPKINQKALNAVPVPVPGAQEQEEIVRRVESLFTLADKVEEQSRAAKQRTDRLTQSILAKAFRGELVPQDPNDEPASELLKRIQAEREVLDKTEPKRKKRTKAVNNRKKTAVSDMKLEDAPAHYLSGLLKDSGGEAEAKELWNKSQLSIDDFYAKLKQEMSSGSILDEQPGRDPQLRKLKLTNNAV